MKAMILTKPSTPLELKEIPKPIPKVGEILVKVEACGVCRTDLHILEGELPLVKSPLILGHQIVGIVEETGQRVGIPWLASTCNHCSFCLEGKENLCDQALFTGYHVDGGFAEYTTCKKDYAIPLPLAPKATDLAPLLCAGLIGFRAYQKMRTAHKIGFYGFGSSAHILLQMAKEEGKETYVFTKENDVLGQRLAKKLGATWVGSSLEQSPVKLDGAIIFASEGSLVPLALQSLEKGGCCVCAGIHMSAIPSFAYEDLFFEKSLSSISHLTRKDSLDFFIFYQTHPVAISTTIYPLEKANDALGDLKGGKVKGSLVLEVS
jgi:propanol-preferring alcohol dehydrogenase